MAYEPLDPRTMLPAAAVAWGPFPLRRARLAGGLGAVAMALLMIVSGLYRHTVTCARSGALAEQCEWQTSFRPSFTRRFPLTALRAVRVIYSETTNKGHTTHWGELTLDISGRELSLRRQPVAGADANAATLQAFLRDPAQQTVRIDTGREVGMLVIGGVFALMGSALLYSVWYGRRRFTFTWDRGTQQLAMQLYWPLGIAVAPPVTWSLREPSEVEIHWEEVKDWLSSARSPGPRGGRLQVRLASGSLVDLLPRPMPGYGVHIRAAEQLRHLLGCRPSAEAAARIAATYESERPRIGPGWTGITGRIAATWLGVCCGSLLGLGIGGALAVLLGFVKLSDSAGGPWFTGSALSGAAAGVALAWRIFLRPDER